ncbi:hypothetical protein P5V15_005496 [Pogonomyrmex californicus]
MGVKDLWNILSPLCERKPLYELEGKTVAIDLSGWVVDSQTIVDNAIQPKMYLRNLYFRTAFLLMHGIFPVFILEGKAPTLKHKTIARRNDVRSKFQERKTAKKGGRSQFNRILNECKELLRYMGIACIQSNGEAEAMCAYLDEDGLVDGCISQDSDCFLYGAKVVYRNFCTSTQGNGGSTGGSVDIYSMEKIEKTLNIGRNKMIALALLCGCDYDEGVNGVGKEAALKFFKTVKEEDVLQRFDFMNKHLCWEPQYAFEKIFILVIRWQLLHLPDFAIGERLAMTNLFIPDKIKKIRNIRSVASYEIIWKNQHAIIEMLKEYKERTKENDNIDDAVDDNLLISIEPQDLVLKCYPELVEVFESTRNIKSKKRTANSRRKKITINADNNTEIKSTTKLKQKKAKERTKKNNKKIDEFIFKNNEISLEDSFEKMAITPKRSKKENILNKVKEIQIRNKSEDLAIMNIKQIKHGPQIKRVLEIEKVNSKLNNTLDKMFNELSPNDFISEDEDEDDLDITNVIENICSKQIFQFNIRNCELIKSTNQSVENIVKEYTKTDKFESVTCTTENNVYTKDEKRKLDNFSDDEFCNINESYIPINQRIQIEDNKKCSSTCNQIEKRFSYDFENIMDSTDDKSIHLDM